jgi:hypothetical protein
VWNGVLSPGFSVAGQDLDLLPVAFRHAGDDLLDDEVRPRGAVVLGQSSGEQQRRERDQQREPRHSRFLHGGHAGCTGASRL